MPNQILPVVGLDQVGLIKDQPPSGLPPQAFSDCRNVRFRDGALLKMEGDVNIFPNLGGGDSDAFIDSDAEIKYVAWWPNPNLVQENSGYYLIIAQMEDTDSEPSAGLCLHRPAWWNSSPQRGIRAGRTRRVATYVLPRWFRTRHQQRD